MAVLWPHFLTVRLRFLAAAGLRATTRTRPIPILLVPVVAAAPVLSLLTATAATAGLGMSLWSCSREHLHVNAPHDRPRFTVRRMTHSPLTDQIKLSSQSSSRQGAKIDTLLVHHTASVSGRGSGVVNMMVNRTRTVSSNYVLGSDGHLWMVVDEDLRAWTSGSGSDGGKGAAWDRRSVTIEICNSSGAPDWGISNASIDKAARLLIDLRRRYGISRVIGHRDLWTQFRASYATFCPGPDTVARILRREAELLGGASPVPVSPWSSVIAVQKRLNVWRRHWGLVLIAEDNESGPETRGATQDAQRRFGIPDDGVVGPQTWPLLEADPPKPEPEPVPPRIAWVNIPPVKMHSWGVSVVVDPLDGDVLGTVAAGSVLDIASSATIDGVLYYRTDWSTRQGNDSGVVSTSLHLTPEPAPEPAPEPTPVEPDPETPASPPFPEPAPVEPGQPDPPPQHAKPQNASGLVAIIVGAIIAAVTAILVLFGQGPTG